MSHSRPHLGFTWAFASPEIMKGVKAVTEIHKKSDVYSFGITLWQLMTRKKPWEAESTGKMAAFVISQNVAQGKRPPISDTDRQQYPKIVSIIEKSWVPNPEARLSFQDIRHSLQKDDQ